ncbi:hypothetical protein B4903_23130 [Yersinia frederiksenii]|nr:hypothetical protein B4903_23130 [Yersinia frederiksenii]
MKAAGNIIQELNIDTDKNEKINLQQYLDDYRRTGKQINGKIRELFKELAKHNDIKKMVEGKVKYNPYRYWAKNNLIEASKFIQSFSESLSHVLIYGYGLDKARVTNKLS